MNADFSSVQEEDRAVGTNRDEGKSIVATPGTLLGVGLLSAAMLTFELTLTRLLAVAQFYHFAFMVISLALLGLGAAGSLLSVWPQLGHSPSHSAAGFAVTTLLSYAILNLIPFDSYTIVWDRRQVLYLLLTFLGAAIPFLFGGLTIGGLLASDAQHLHRIYAANLVGSGLGCVIFLPLLGWLGGEGALFASAALGAAAAGLFRTSARRFWALVRWGTIGLGVASLLALAIVRPAWAALRLSPYKALSQVLLAADARHTVSAWSLQGRVDVVESGTIHVMPGLSQNALIARPPLQAGLTLDGDDLKPITALAPQDDLARTLAAYVPEAVAVALRPEAAHYLILEPGGGWSVLMALANSVPRVTVVERNPLVVHILQNEYERFTFGLYRDPRVEVIAVDARTYVRQTRASFDVALVALSDSFHPVTSGAYSLSEDYRYTVEALSDYLDRLAPNGVLVLTRWLQRPPTESVRMLATIRAALAQRGITHPEAHIAAFRSLRTMTFVASSTPLSATDRAAVRSFAASRGYDLVWLPDISLREVNRYSRLPEPLYYNAALMLFTDAESFIASYAYDIRPATDDRPFFFHYFRWRQTPEVLARLGQMWQPFGGSGYLVLVALLILVTALAALLICGPLVIRRAEEKAIRAPSSVKYLTLVYFSMLGMAFLFVEIPLAQRFILFLGQPALALAVVLFAILIFSGLGSLSAPRWPLRAALAALVAVALMTPLLLRGVFALALGWPLIARVAVTIASLAPLGMLMGIPFARGVVLVEQKAPGLIPWAWAINGSASVISGVLAAMAALSWGFSAVLWLGAGGYAVALAAISRLMATSPVPRA